MGGVDPYTNVTVAVDISAYALTQAISFMVLVAVYVFQSISFYTIAQRRGLCHCWLAWVPVGRSWLLGSIADQYQYVVNGKVRSRRKLLLGVGLGTVVACFLLAVCLALSMSASDANASTAFWLILLSFLAMAAAFTGVVIMAVYTYICYFDLFRSCEPSNGVLFLLLSIFFYEAQAFILFAIRNRDGGMPPRRKRVQVEEKPEEPIEGPIEEPVEEPAEMIETTEENVEKEEETNEQTIPVADA